MGTTCQVNSHPLIFENADWDSDWEDVIIRYSKDETGEWTATQIYLSYHGKYDQIDWGDIQSSMT